MHFKAWGHVVLMYSSVASNTVRYSTYNEYFVCGAELYYFMHLYNQLAPTVATQVGLFVHSSGDCIPPAIQSSD